MRLVLCLLPVFAIGCGRIVVRVPIVTPAEVPVQTFPHVLVAAVGANPMDSDAIARRIVQYLESGPSNAELIDGAQVPARMRGPVPAPTVLLLLDCTVGAQMVAHHIREPETICGPTGCFTRNRTRTVHVPEWQGQLRLEVRAVPSGEVLQRMTLQSERRRGEMGSRAIVVRQLESELRNALAPRERQERVVIRRIPVPEATPARDLMASGQFAEAREILETHLPQATTLPPKERAAYLYHLGLTRRFDRSGHLLNQGPARDRLAAHDAQFEAAREALETATRLDPDPLYAAALNALRRQRQDLATFAAQQDAANHNYRVQGSAGGSTADPSGVPPIPTAPDSYR